MSQHLDILRQHQQWRLGKTTVMERPEAVGDAIDYAIAVVEAAENLVKVKGRHNGELAYRGLVDAVKLGDGWTAT